MLDNPLIFGVVLSLFAGLATTVGATIAFAVRRFSARWLAILLGLAAGVMISISFIELLGEAMEMIGLAWASVAFFVGFGVIFLVDVLVPHDYESEHVDAESAKLHRTGKFTAVGVAIHNFPEGLVVVAGAAASPELGILLAIAVAIHNIPEGIAVAVPILQATGSRTKAFLYAFFSGLAEPVGALLGALVAYALHDGAGVGRGARWSGGPDGLHQPR